MHNWNIIGPDPATLPPHGQMVWLYEAGEDFDRDDWGGCGCSLDQGELQLASDLAGNPS